MTQRSVDKAMAALINPTTPQQRNVARIAVVGAMQRWEGDRPVHSEDGEFLGHWQHEAWVKRLRSLVRELADVEKDKWSQHRS
jgi:hypothetical protein